MKIYLVQPMTARRDEVIDEERARLVSWVRENYPEAVIINEHRRPLDGRTHLQALASDLIDMSNADLVLFCPGWKAARGCGIMHDCARAYSLKTAYIRPTSMKDRTEEAFEDDGN